jgi:hypothetical protein
MNVNLVYENNHGVAKGVMLMNVEETEYANVKMTKEEVEKLIYTLQNMLKD